MTTLYIFHEDCLEHRNAMGHPECAERLRSIEKTLEAEQFAVLQRAKAPLAEIEAIERAHPLAYIEAVKDASPDDGLAYIDGDTSMSPGSWRAALRSAGGGILGVDKVMRGEVENVFCATRPPGHHAEKDTAMGFCLFSNIAIAALHARAVHGAERVAVVDFDVHHGNGTQDIFWSDKDLFYGSTHQMPLFPGSGDRREEGEGNICNAPLRANDGSAQFKEAMSTRLLPALEAFSPDIVLISAGFDAHRDDPLASVNLVEEDFRWITLKLADIAHQYAEGRIVSMLEGGYDLDALGRSAGIHVEALIEAGS